LMAKSANQLPPILYGSVGEFSSLSPLLGPSMTISKVIDQFPTNEDHGMWRPEIVDPRSDDDCDRLTALISSRSVLRCRDTIVQQLGDLIAARHPAENFDDATLDVLVKKQLCGLRVADYGRWIYYPWSGQLVHLLPEDEFRELRSDRNRNRITSEEQLRLRQCTIGVMGLSVGQASALTLAIEGVGGHFRIADFDTLALSNLNRLRAGTHEIGLNKAIICARQMFEIDPYLDIEIFPDGITEDNVSTFLGRGSEKLSVLVEECDDLFIKIVARELARERGIPVVMDTNDRGLIDIERFDLEPARPLLHGSIRDLSAHHLRGLTMAQKVPHLMRMIGERTISTRLAGSIPEIKRTISTWPQLASGVALGGALVTDTIRRILLGEMKRSGRFFVDMEAIITDNPDTAGKNVDQAQI
jgi:molybdopterin/thiamine biosynthesis adenylyltransferase